MKMKDVNDIRCLSTPLPEDIQQVKSVGDYGLAKELIKERLLSTRMSKTLKKRLTMELEVLKALESDQYPFSEKEALKMMEDAFVDFHSTELQTLVKAGEIDWVYKMGERYYQRRFLMNLVKTRRDYYERYRYEEENNIDNERQTELDDNVVLMKQKGKRKAKITLRQTIAPKAAFSQTEGPFLAHLPLPKANGATSALTVHQYSDSMIAIDPTDAVQRTIAFSTNDPTQLSFEVTHSYEIEANYHDLYPLLGQIDFPKQLSAEEQDLYQQSLIEKEPHIQFTPFLADLLAEITDEGMTLVQKAYAIYCFITTQVNYSYMREYFAVANISEYCAVNQKGDCGVQALLFITLCRMVGIPAQWESGLYISEYTQGPHDWAKFYLPTVGWVYADLSFGGSAYRGNKEARWHYYFGNLDIYRMPANSDIQGSFIVEKQQLRADPIDNQRGEFETAHQGLRYEQLHWQVELQAFELKDE